MKCLADEGVDRQIVDMQPFGEFSDRLLGLAALENQV